MVVVTYQPKKLFIFNEASIESISEHIENPDGRDGYMCLNKDYLFLTSFSLVFKIKTSTNKIVSIFWISAFAVW